jgi:hypothetical protein
MKRFMRDASIKAKLTVIVMLACITALVIAGVTVIVYDRISFKQAMIRDSEVLADVIG